MRCVLISVKTGRIMMRENRRNEEEQMKEMIRLSSGNIKVPNEVRPDVMERRIRKLYGASALYYIRRFSFVFVGFVLVLAISFGIWQYRSTKHASKKRTAVKSTATTMDDAGILARASDYNALYKLIKEAKDNEVSAYDRDTDIMLIDEDAVTEDAATDGTSTDKTMGIARDSAASADSASAVLSEDYSSTNTQEKTVDEGDVVKSDGKNLYILSGDGTRVTIVPETADGKLSVASTIELFEGNEAIQKASVSTIYITDGILTVIYTPTTMVYAEDQDETDTTTIRLYSVKDVKNPVLLYETSQSGTLVDSRISDGYVYTFTRFHVYACEKDREESFVPSVNGKILNEDCICVPEYINSADYLVLTSVRLSGTENGVGSDGSEETPRLTDSLAILSCASDYYVSENNIYLTQNNYRIQDEYQTEIVRISYQKGILSPRAKSAVEGTLLNNYALSEYDGYLRVVTTQYNDGNNMQDMPDMWNNVYILDQDMQITGSIEGMADEESVYAVRFIGSMVYFVTYRNTDPLFACDLSDPEDPKLLDSLKVPGFSNYLHYFDDRHLLGVGEDDTGSVKLSMFDVSDSTDVSETASLILDNTTYSSLFENYHAIMIDPEQYIFGIETGYYDGTASSYRIFRYDDETESFIQIFERELVSEEYYANVRGFLSGENFFLVQDYVVESYSRVDYTKIDAILTK